MTEQGWYACARIGASTNAGVLQLRLRMTARNKQQQQQIPYGNDKKKGKYDEALYDLGFTSAVPCGTGSSWTATS